MILARFRLVNKEPRLILHDEKEIVVKELEFLRGKFLSKKRYCIGYSIDLANRVPCGREVSNGYLCEECKKRDVISIWATGLKSRIEEIEVLREFCNNYGFYVYLAYFGGRGVKVGIAHEKRLYERLWEQGAIAYKIYRKYDNCFEALETEKELSFRYPDRMRWKDKILLYSKLDLDWFDRNFGIDGVIKENLENIKYLRGKILVDYIGRIPDIEIRTIGELLILDKYLISFRKLKGRKIINSPQGLFAFIK